MTKEEYLQKAAQDMEAFVVTLINGAISLGTWSEKVVYAITQATDAAFYVNDMETTTAIVQTIVEKNFPAKQ